MEPSKGPVEPDTETHAPESPGSELGVSGDASHSLENPSPIQGAPQDALPRPIQRFPLLLRIWHKFNIYLLLFILLIIIAIAITVVLFIKNKNSSTNNSNTNSLSAQNLSTQAQKQLSDTNVNIGTSSQVLNVASNSIFQGSVLVRGDLEVAGTIKANGNLQLPGITVSGSSTFGQLQASSLAVGGAATVQGPLTADQGLTVNGNATFNGLLSASQLTANSLTLNGDLTLTHHITAGGSIPSLARGSAVGSGGTASVSGSDTSGSITINTGSSPPSGCFATITFAQSFNSTPHIIITPIGSGAAGLQFFVNRSTTNFSVCTANSAPSGQTFGFDYLALD